MKNSQQGFTLLEVLIALTIMAVAFAAILSIEAGSIESSIKTRNMITVQMLARNLMIETERKIESKVFSEIKKEDAGQFEAPYQEYKWKREVKEIEFPDLSMLLAKKSDAAAGDVASALGGAPGAASNNWMVEQMTKKVSEYITKAIREVTITVIWKRGTGEQTYSLSTYWVSLNEPFKF